MAESLRVSVVLNTVNRDKYLGKTLEGLRQQSYTNFEVIVVNGPSTDNTEEIAKSFNIRYYTAPYNISVSRNVGIKHASGDIIAFIDDDAIPEPDWLRDIVAGYSDENVGAVGGCVYGHLGYEFQFKYGRIDKWGHAELSFDKPFDSNDPNGEWFNINIGTNTSFRRSYVVEIGGFDEEYEYYHDESDVCVRMVKAGYKIVQLPNAFVHHKFAESRLRSPEKKITNWDPIAKNVIYFGIVNTKGLAPMYKRILNPGRKLRQKVKLHDIYELFKSGDYNIFQYFYKNFTLVRSVFRGYWRAFIRGRKLLDGYSYEPKNFKPYIKKGKKFTSKVQVLVSQGYPPVKTDGIARYMHTLASELVRAGRRTFVVTHSPDDVPFVDFIDGVWIYQYNPTKNNSHASGAVLADELSSSGKGALEIVKLLQDKVEVEHIGVTSWDAEGLSLVHHKLVPTTVLLSTPLKAVVETQWEDKKEHPDYNLVYEMEKYTLENADGIIPNSDGIKDTFAKLYDINWKNLEDKTTVSLIPHGVDRTFTENEVETATRSKDTTKMLYVGRFEKRKGMDLIFDILPGLMKKNKNFQVLLVGDKNVEYELGRKYWDEFKKEHGSTKWFDRIEAPGYVSEEELRRSYADCDLFIAPSRYESFGLICIEAMAFSKPVVAAAVGGMQEIVEHNKTGLLIDYENTEQLKQYIQKLIDQPALRIKMGKAGHKLLVKKFSGEVFAHKYLDHVKRVINQ